MDIISGSIGTAKNLKRVLEANNQMNDGTGKILSFLNLGYEVEDKETLSAYNELLVLLDRMSSITTLV